MSGRSTKPKTKAPKKDLPKGWPKNAKEWKAAEEKYKGAGEAVKRRGEHRRGQSAAAERERLKKAKADAAGKGQLKPKAATPIVKSVAKAGVKGAVKKGAKRLLGAAGVVLGGKELIDFASESLSKPYNLNGKRSETHGDGSMRRASATTKPKEAAKKETKTSYLSYHFSSMKNCK